jgi:hypothetical protein
MLSRPASTQQTGTVLATPPAGETVALRAATQLINARSDLAKIWPGFWGAEHVFGIFPVRAGTLVLHPQDNPVGEDPAVSGVILPATLKGRASLLPGRVGHGYFDLYFKLGDRLIAAVSLIPPFAPYRGTASEMGWLSDSTASLVMFAVHESFHGYQTSTWRPLPDQVMVFANSLPLKPHLAMLDSLWVLDAFAGERAALKRAVGAASCAETYMQFKSYSAIRDERLAKLPGPFRAYEDAHERAEGIANWVGYEGVHRAVTHDLAGVGRTVLGDLEFSYRDGSGKAYRGWDAYSLWHLYVTGAAKTAILARCGSADWRARIAEGASLQQLLDGISTSGQDTLPPPLAMHGDTLIVHPRTPGARELRMLVTPDTIWMIDGAQRTLASPERAKAARSSLKVLGLIQRDHAADSAFLAKHPEFKRPKP